MGGQTRAVWVFGRQNALDGNVVGSMGLKRDRKARIGQRVVAAMSLADYLYAYCGFERSRNIPGYKASSRRT
jgi:hypothetical protein